MELIGIDIGGTSVKLGVINDKTEIVYRAQHPAEKDPERMTANLSRMIELAWRERGRLPVGIACAGWVNGGRVSADNLSWGDVPLSDMLHDSLGVGIPMGNDAHLAMLAEWRRGSLIGLEHCIYLTLGTGVGGGIIVNGAPYRGEANLGGEIGHMITHAGGLACPCGQHGCYEMYASAGALSRMAGGRSARAILDEASEGGSCDALDSYLSEVCLGLVGLMAIFAPQAISIGGGISNAGQFLLDRLLIRLRNTPGYGGLHSHVSVRLAKFGNDAGIIGAAELARKNAI